MKGCPMETPSAPVFGSYSANAVAPVAQQLDPFDDHGLRKELSLQDRLFENGIQLRITITSGAGSVLRASD